MLYLTKTRLKNCQGVRDLTFEFSPGLNVFRADNNNVGKSIFFKILREAVSPGYWGRYGKAQLIRFGAEEATAEYEFSDGTMCVFVLKPNSRKYTFTFGDGETLVSDLPPKEFLDRMSIVGTDETVANILTTQSDLLFVESSSKTDRELLSLLTSSQEMDNVIEQATEGIKTFAKMQETAGEVRNYLEGELERIELLDTESMKSSLEFLQLFGEALGVMETVDDLIDANLFLHQDRRMLDDVAALTKTLEVLDKFQYLSLEEKAEVPDLYMLQRTVSLLEDLGGLTTVEEEVDVDLIRSGTKVLGILGKFIELSQRYIEETEMAGALMKELEEVRALLANSEEKGFCPFYRKEVFFNEQGCIPCDF